MKNKIYLLYRAQMIPQSHSRKEFGRDPMDKTNLERHCPNKVVLDEIISSETYYFGR
jgi:hypothetical protein